MVHDSLTIGPAPNSGNGKVLELAEEPDAVTVRFMSEPRTSPEPLWFHLRAEGVARRRVRFVWQNADGCLGLGSREHLGNARPVARADGGEWHRVEVVEIMERPEGGFILEFDAPAAREMVSVAFCYPYGPVQLQRTLCELPEAWGRETIGLTGKGRELTRVRWPRPEAEGPVPGVYVAARQHAGETPASWVLDGLLREVAEAGGAPGDGGALEWWAVPFVDLDGVVEGNYGKDALPHDFNRAWAAMPMRPEVQALQQDMRRFGARAAPRLVLDLHAPGGGEVAFYHFLPRQERPREQREAAETFTPFLAEQFPCLPAEQLSRVPRYASRWNADETLTCWAWDHLKETLGIAVETTYQRIGEKEWLGPDDYRDLGRRVARAATNWVRSRE